MSYRNRWYILRSLYFRAHFSTRRETCHNFKVATRQSATRRVMPTLDSTAVRLYSKNANDGMVAPGAMRKHNLLLADMDAVTIRNRVSALEDLEALVTQLEDMGNLSQADMYSLIHPLVEACRNLSLKKPLMSERVADLAERILFHCLALIPSDISQRLEGYEDASDLSSLPPYPNEALYTKVMSIVGSLRSEEAAKRVNRLFRLMTAEHRAEVSHVKANGEIPENCRVRAPKPNMSTFKSLLRAWSVAGTAQAAKEAENVLVMMEELCDLRSSVASESRNVETFLSINAPDIECYNMVLSAYSRVNAHQHPMVFDRAFTLFRRMHHLQESHLVLDWFSYRSFLFCVQSRLTSIQQPLDGNFVEELERLVPQLCSVAIPRRVLAKYRDVPTHPRAWALGVIVKAILHETTEKKNIETGTMLVRRMVGDESFEYPTAVEVGSSELWPPQESLVLLSKAWRNSQLPEREQVLEWIRSVAERTIFSRASHAHLAMDVWMNSLDPDAALIVQSFLDRLLEDSNPFEPNGETFAVVMRTWMRSNDANRAWMVEKLLSTMQELEREKKSFNFSVHERHIGILLETWKTMSRDGQRYPGKLGLLYPAEHASLHLKKLLSSKTWDPRNYHHFSTCLKAWKEQILEPGDTVTFPSLEAAKLLEGLQLLSGEIPPAPLCNLVLQSCLRTDIPIDRRLQAYRIAVHTFSMGSHDPVSYVFAVDIVKRSFDKLRDDHFRFIEEIVEASKKGRHLSQSLIYEAIEVLGKEELIRLFHFTSSYADRIVNERATKLVRPNGKRLRWDGPTPHGLKLDNLPRSWSSKTEYSKL